MGRIKANTSDAKQRILETADRLFYEEGIHSVGVDRIIAEAGAAKMTLYSHFRSKDDLITAVLKFREERVLEFFAESVSRHSETSSDKLACFFAALKDWFGSPGFRGCSFQNAAIELADPSHAGTLFVREHKLRFGEILRGFVEQSLGSDASTLAPMVALLVEGAVVTAVVQGKPDAAEIARDAAFRLVASAKPA